VPDVNHPSIRRKSQACSGSKGSVIGWGIDFVLLSKYTQRLYNLHASIAPFEVEAPFQI
jgi:hypothetical protein